MSDSAAFSDFCRRFVVNYWTEVAEGSADLPGSEPSQQTPDELLAEINFASLCDRDGSRERVGLFTLNMTNGYGDDWQFVFRFENGLWTIHSATSGSRSRAARVDWLDEVYSQWFLPHLNRLILKSL